MVYGWIGGVRTSATTGTAITGATDTVTLGLDNSGSLFVNTLNQENNLAWQDQNKCRPKRFIEELRDEIGAWHGDILRAA